MYLRDRRIVGGRFEQLERGTTGRYEMRSHALRCDLLGRFDVQPQPVTIEREGLVEARHGDPDVIQLAKVQQGFRRFQRFARWPCR